MVYLCMGGCHKCYTVHSHTAQYLPPINWILFLVATEKQIFVKEWLCRNMNLDQFIDDTYRLTKFERRLIWSLINPFNPWLPRSLKERKTEVIHIASI